MVKGVGTAVSNGLSEGHNSEKQRYCLTYLIYQSCYCVIILLGGPSGTQTIICKYYKIHNKLIDSNCFEGLLGKTFLGRDGVPILLLKSLMCKNWTIE